MIYEMSCSSLLAVVDAIAFLFGIYSFWIIGSVEKELRGVCSAADFTQQVGSIQIEHKDVQQAKVGDQVGGKVSEHVRENDEVFKVIS